MKPFQCKCCHAELGVTDGDVLVIGGTRIENPVILHCLACGSSKREWRPLGINSRADEKRERLAARMNARIGIVMGALAEPSLDIR